MKRIFICSPYRGDIQANTARARALCALAIQEGHAPFAPHLFYPAILDDTVASERDAGIRCGIAWLDACNEVWATDGERSDGMRAELERAATAGKPIVVRAGVARRYDT